MNDERPSGIVHVPRRFVAGEWGGTETVILEIARRQQQAGARPEILSSMALADRRQEYIGGVPVRRFSYTYPFLGLSRAECRALDKKGGNLLSLSLFKALLTERDVRLFHAHALNRLGGTVRTAARLRGKPYVVSVHGGVFDVPAAERNELLRPIAHKPEWGRIFGALLGARRVLEDADQVIFVGHSEFEEARRHLSHDRIAYLPNGVDTARFRTGDGSGFRKRHGIPDNAFLVLNISRIDAQKNQRLLLEAFARLQEHQPDAFLVLIGPETQPAYAASLREFVSRNQLVDRVRILPGLRNDDPDLVNAYHACDVFVLPSMHEPFGIVVLEAWSAGRPVIANRVGGLRALIRHGENGLFISSDSDATPEALAARLHELASSPAMRRHLAAGGVRDACASYDWSRVATQLEHIYQAAEAHAAGRARRHRP